MRLRILFSATLVFALLIVVQPLTASHLAQTATPMPKPFGLPFADPPGPNTWYLGGGYGNTVGAYYQRDTTYLLDRVYTSASISPRRAARPSSPLAMGQWIKWMISSIMVLAPTTCCFNSMPAMALYMDICGNDRN